MSKLRTKLALDVDYLKQPIDIQLDIITIPYIEKVGKAIADQINFPFSGAVTDEIYKILIDNYQLGETSTLREIQDAVLKSAEIWKQNVEKPQQNVAKRRG